VLSQGGLSPRGSHLLAQQGHEPVEAHDPEVLTAPGADGNRAALRFPVTHDEQVRDALQRVLADFKAIFSFLKSVSTRNP